MHSCLLWGFCILSFLVAESEYYIYIYKSINPGYKQLCNNLEILSMTKKKSYLCCMCLLYNLLTSMHYSLLTSSVDAEVFISTPASLELFVCSSCLPRRGAVVSYSLKRKYVS